MKQILSLVLSFILASCTTTGATATPVVAVNTEINPTATFTLPTQARTPSATATLTLTPEPPCDPFMVDYCIAEGHFLFQRPIHPPANDRVDLTYRYGSTANGTRDPHHGVEFANASGTPVYAAGAGKVIFAGPDEEATYAPWGNFYGNLVVIEHEGQIFTLYAHLSKVDVVEGQKVGAEDKIGEVGRTGGAIGSHLHFEVRRGDVADYFATQNPELWLVPAQDENGNRLGTLIVRLLSGDGSLIKNANITMGQYADPAASAIQNFYATAYSPDLLTGEETAAFGDLPAGHYRIVVETNGQMLERWVEVESGRLTQVVFVVK